MRRSRQPMFGTTRPSRGAVAGTWAKRGLVVALVLGVVGLGSLLLGWRSASGNLARVSIPAIEAGREADASRDVLVVEWSPEELGEGAPLRDVLLMQFHPDRARPVVVTFPPALKVEVPGFGDQRLEAVRALGDADLLVSVIEDYVGLQLDHYVEVRRDGVADLVDHLGGVQVCPSDVDACTTIDAAEARSRMDATGADDAFQAVARQAELLGAVGQSLSRRSLVFNPLRISGTVDAVATAVTVDDAVGARDLLRHARALADANPAELDVRVLPGFLSPQTGFVHALPEETASLFQALREGTALPTEVGTEAPQDLDPADVRVLVLNGEGSEGLASQVADLVTAAGFAVTGTDNHSTFDVETTFILTTGPDEPRAQLLTEVFPDAEVRVVPRLEFTGVHAIVVVGADRGGVAADGTGP